MITRKRNGAVFFDLDGTLLDTAPDMVGALDRLRAEADLEPVDYALARQYVSHGALGMLGIGFGHLDEASREALRERYLTLYAERLADNTRLFPGMAALLDELDASGTPWGVVTNKPAFLTEPLLDRLHLARRCACIVSGDTLSTRKPDPEPLLHAARLAGAQHAVSIYIGDDRRDIDAGRGAGMITVAVKYGYIKPDEDPSSWGADYLVSTSQDLHSLLHRQGWLEGE